MHQKKSANNSKIKYLNKDSEKLGWSNEWDLVIIVNSVLSENDIENRNILSSCFEALKKGGILLGLFPTILASLDISHLDKENTKMQYDLNTNIYFEEIQNVAQIFYTPLRLKYILKDAGYLLKKMEIFFCDSPFFKKQSKTYYNVNDEDLSVYELFVVAGKNKE